MSRHDNDSGEAAEGERGPNGKPFTYDADLANEIELRWQERWERDGTFATANPSGRLVDGKAPTTGDEGKRAYILDMFPYPSGSGLHVGHPLGYIGTDAYARYLRMTGHHVLHPFGYDAFGLPAEQYAIETGQHPEVTTRQNIANMRRQLRRLGLGHDTRREIATSDVSFYTWTQWIFLQIFESWYDDRVDRCRPISDLVDEFRAGRLEPVGRTNPTGRPWEELDESTRRAVIDEYRLAYLSEEVVNWCPGLGTVLANEEVTADGRSDVGNHPVYRRPLRQWMLRITAYADRLLADLDTIDWPEPIKQMQRNWIGASEGATVRFPLSGAEGSVSSDPDHGSGSNTIAVFTTRPDTLPGATFLVLAPEHQMVDRLVASSWPRDTPMAWRSPIAGESGEDGAAASPAQAVAAYREQAAALAEWQRTDDARAKTGVFTGSYVRHPMSGAELPVFVADYVLTGYGTGAVMAVPAHDQRDLEFANRFGLPVRTVVRPSEEWCDARGLAADAPAESWPEAYTGDGRYADTGLPDLELDGLSVAEAVRATTEWLRNHGAGYHTRTYRLRDWLFSRQRYWGEPFPIVYDEWGPVALPENMLPVTLPEMTDFRPEPQEDENSDPLPPLGRVPEWYDVRLDLGDGPKRYRRELNTMPQWAGSCWYYLRYLDPTNDKQLVDPEVERYWMADDADPTDSGRGGVDLYVGGVEHAVLHLLYARFFHKVLYDLGHVSTREPFARLFNQGYILADAFTDARGMYVPAAEVERGPDGETHYHGEPVTRRSGKMGKSLKNSVTPDEIYADYGADTLRLYELAMGPLDTDRPWHTDDIVGVHRFLQRLWHNIVDRSTGELAVTDLSLQEESEYLLHRTIRSVREDFEQLRFNTAIARLIELNTHAGKLASEHGTGMPRMLAEPLVLMVAPLAPHIAEELWHRLGHTETITYQPFPEYDETRATRRTVSLPVQVNGKVRFQVEVSGDATEETIHQAVLAAPDYQTHTAGGTVDRMIVVPGRIVNVVLRADGS